MRVNTILVGACAVTLCGAVNASSPDEWAAHYREVDMACLQKSRLEGAQRVGNFMLLGDQRVAFTGVLVQGRYPQAYMKNKCALVLCLFERGGAKAVWVEDVDAPSYLTKCAH
jgi:hypothetical protein